MKLSTYISSILFLLASNNLWSQQEFSPTHFFYQSELFNPAQYGASEDFRVTLLHQQRNSGSGIGANGQMIALQSPGQGQNQALGWGFNVQMDSDFPLRRVKMSGGMAAQLIKTDQQRLSLGLNLGISTISWNFSETYIYHPSDPLAAPGTALNPDAALGLEYEYSGEKFTGLFSTTVSQIPGSMFSSNSYGFDFYRHLTVLGRGKFELKDGISLSPQLLYRNILSKQFYLPNGWLDLGARVDLTKSGIYAGLGYRLNQAGMHGLFGIRIFKGEKAQELGLSFLFEMPLNGSSALGPNLEMGLNWRWGRN